MIIVGLATPKRERKIKQRKPRTVRTSTNHNKMSFELNSKADMIAVENVTDCSSHRMRLWHTQTDDINSFNANTIIRLEFNTVQVVFSFDFHDYLSSDINLQCTVLIFIHKQYKNNKHNS